MFFCRARSYGCLAILMPGFLFPDCGEGNRPLAVATGNPAGVYYPLGGAMASHWTAEIPGIVVKAEVTAGSVTNLIQVARKESDIGFSQADAVADALAGRGRFPEPLPLLVLGRLYPNVVHLVSVRSRGIEKVEDLRGKRVSVGPPGSGNQVTAWNVLETLGFSPGDFRVRQLNYAQSIAALKDGRLDALFLAAGLGVSSIVELGLTRDLVLVPFTGQEIGLIEARNPAYEGFDVPPGVYRGVEEPVLTPSLWNMLVVHQDMPESLVASLTSSLLQGRDGFLRVTPNARFIERSELLKIGSLPAHPGASRVAPPPARAP